MIYLYQFSSEASRAGCLATYSEREARELKRLSNRGSKYIESADSLAKEQRKKAQAKRSHRKEAARPPSLLPNISSYA